MPCEKALKVDSATDSFRWNDLNLVLTLLLMMFQGFFFSNTCNEAVSQPLFIQNVYCRNQLPHAPDPFYVFK